MHKGDWELEKNAKCYLWCILNMYKLVNLDLNSFKLLIYLFCICQITKDNAFDWEAGIVTLTNQAPESIRTPAIISVKNCKDAVQTPSDKCAAAYEIAHCMYLDNPEVKLCNLNNFLLNHFFPELLLTLTKNTYFS